MTFIDPSSEDLTRYVAGQHPISIWQRFNSGVDRRNPTENGCWLWTRSVGSHGYGQISQRKLPGMSKNPHPRTSHTMAWEQANGQSVPKGMVVRHTCDVRRCCNPEHLIIGNRKDNIHDAISRDRHMRGERSSNAVLTDAAVIEIRRLAASGAKHKDMAVMFGAHSATIRDAVLGITWKHLPMSELKKKVN